MGSHPIFTHPNTKEEKHLLCNGETDMCPPGKYLRCPYNGGNSVSEKASPKSKAGAELSQAFLRQTDL